MKLATIALLLLTNACSLSVQQGASDATDAPIEEPADEAEDARDIARIVRAHEEARRRTAMLEDERAAEERRQFEEQRFSAAISEHVIYRKWESERRTTNERQREFARRAAAKGFTAAVYAEDGGVHDGLLEAIVNGDELDVLKSVIFEVSSVDAAIVAAQVQPGMPPLFLSRDHAGLRLLLRGYEKAISEGTPLTALKLEAVRVTGLQAHTTANGSTAQAFVVEPVW